MIIPPDPFTLEDPLNLLLEDSWYARQQLFFTCWFRPMDCRQPSQSNYTIGPDDFEMKLVAWLRATASKPQYSAPAQHHALA
jgi:hypothetical protein